MVHKNISLAAVVPHTSKLTSAAGHTATATDTIPMVMLKLNVCYFINSIKPKESTALNTYKEVSETDNGTIFQPSSHYNLLTVQAYEDVPDNNGPEEIEKEEQIYEVLDRDDEKPKLSTDRRAMITGGNAKYYDTLEFKE